MKRKAVVLVMLAVFLIAGQIAFAGSKDNVISVVERANSLIESLIDQAVQIVANLNEDAEGYDEAVQSIGEALVKMTSAISTSVIKWAEKQGVTVECYPVEVVLGNQIFIVDPLRVIDD
ncbi:hypothetical protein [Kosmotoga pacifica]|uniref:Uncharacterized protein n=1 Tax=Kosmotoga pacifica TaxID=1330330 RepID=A0A0G2ZD36_9BACT|nr:hypothetical protein [Kosmotoga pacifica]AKI97976.1 hypothetical protein IX53_09245 [Kosmotoga pacifica]